MCRNKFIICSFTIVFMAMAIGLLLLQNIGTFPPVRADSKAVVEDLGVVGQPSLPAATVDAILKSLGSPMDGTGQVVVQASKQANIDDAFALAVWWTETNDGAAGVGLADRNPGGVRRSVGYPSAFDGYTIYPSYPAAISYWFNLIRSRYVNRGLSTVYAISYPYVGTSSSYLWAGKVVALMLRYRGEAPPPATPTVAPGPTISPSMLPHHKKVIDTAIHAYPYQGQKDTTTKRSSSEVQQASASPDYFIAVFALLLALAIVVWSLRLGKRQSIQGLRVHTQNLEAPDTDALYAGALNVAAIINTDTLPDLPSIPPVHTMPANPSGDLLPPGRGTNFPVRRTILLPSVPLPAAPGTSTTGSRPAGLLSRYGATQQESC